MALTQAISPKANAIAQPNFSQDVEKGIDFCKRSSIHNS
ncbi:hypothetical protein GXM_04409 [Nostoc sphaeroides CCNUC1]|uniref:Uncharacterized protein n=1 Tax=Nostoc sphaeroides CCNUC1 TaxID=2653204 RepID=A0A5P8W2H5_9NOSO|nr:hypothetical protein GXM_04409 [Nostoc sphaeroides CCNUC1]